MSQVAICQSIKFFTRFVDTDFWITRIQVSLVVVIRGTFESNLYGFSGEARPPPGQAGALRAYPMLPGATGETDRPRCRGAVRLRSWFAV